MAGLQGLGSGFIQGYGLVSDIQDRNRARDLQERRYDDQQAYREQQLGLQREQAEYARERDAIGDERWNKQFEADQGYREDQMGLRKQQLGISAMNARTSARRNDLAAQQQQIEIAQVQRQEREVQRRRSLTAGAQELKTNGVTPRFRKLMKDADVPIDQFNDPSWRKAKETVVAGLQGAPIDRRQMVDAAGKLYQHRIDRVVGGQTQDGREIVRAQLDNFFPSEDGESVRLDLKLWAKDKNGNVEEYNAPVTPGRSSADEYVMDVPLDEAIGYVKGLDILDQAVPRQQLQSLINQEITLSGGSEAGETGEWVRGPSNTLFNRNTSEIKNVPMIGDEKKRYVSAMEFATAAYEAASKGFNPPDALSEEEQKLPLAQQEALKKERARRFILNQRDTWLELSTPEETIGDPDESVLRKLEEEGGSFVAPGGKYAGREVRMKQDGTVVVR